MASEGPDEQLAALRGEIDRIDGDLHRLLMERGAIIDRLIAAKGTAASGSAFRPEREAAMMRVLCERHRGRLPFDAVEGIWRVIISTFTHVQAPFAVHATAGREGAAATRAAAAARDVARFHFGYSVPLHEHPDAAAVIAAVANSRGDLGLVDPAASTGAWWRALEGSDGPKVIARLPFVERPDHPAGRETLVVARTMSGEGLGAVVLYAAPDEAPDLPGSRAIARADRSTLLSLPREAAPGGPGAGYACVGSHPAPFRPGEVPPGEVPPDAAQAGAA